MPAGATKGASSRPRVRLGAGAWTSPARAARIVLLALVAFLVGCPPPKGAKEAGEDGGPVAIEYVPIAVAWVRRHANGTPAEIAAWAKTPAAQGAVQPDIRHVLVSIGRDAPPKRVAAAKRRAVSLAMRIAKGERIQSLVEDESDDEATKAQGGSLGKDAASIQEPARGIAQSLEPGEVTIEPVRTAAGFHVFARDRADPADLEKAYRKARAPDLARRLADEMLSRMQASSEDMEDIAHAAVVAILPAAKSDRKHTRPIVVSPDRASKTDLPEDAREALASFARHAKPGDVVNSALGTGPVLVVARAVAARR